MSSHTQIGCKTRTSNNGVRGIGKSALLFLYVHLFCSIIVGAVMKPYARIVLYGISLFGVVPEGSCVVEWQRYHRMTLSLQQCTFTPFLVAIWTGGESQCTKVGR